jgi:hypothetical protein
MVSLSDEMECDRCCSPWDENTVDMEQGSCKGVLVHGCMYWRNLSYNSTSNERSVRRLSLTTKRVTFGGRLVVDGFVVDRDAYPVSIMKEIALRFHIQSRINQNNSPSNDVFFFCSCCDQVFSG